MPVSNDTLLRVGAIIQARDRPEVIAEAATSGAVFKNKQAVGLLVGLKIFHAGNFQLNIMPLRETSDDAPGTIPSS